MKALAWWQLLPLLVAVLLTLLLLVGCTDPHALTYTSTSAPVWNLNPHQWTP